MLTLRAHKIFSMKLRNASILIVYDSLLFISLKWLCATLEVAPEQSKHLLFAGIHFTNLSNFFCLKVFVILPTVQMVVEAQ